MTQRRKRPRRIDPEIRERIEAWAAERLSGPQILARLERDELFASRAPTLRTVQSVMREARMPEIRPDFEAWTVATAAADEAQHVLPVLGCVIDQTAGQVVSLRRDHAAWVARLRAALPHLGEWNIYLQAGQYANAIERGTPTAMLDRRLAWLAWAPTARAQEAEGEAWARGEAAMVSWTPAAMRGMARVPADQVSPDVRLSVEQARKDLEEQNHG